MMDLLANASCENATSALRSLLVFSVSNAASVAEMERSRLHSVYTGLEMRAGVA